MSVIDSLVTARPRAGWQKAADDAVSVRTVPSAIGILKAAQIVFQGFLGPPLYVTSR